MNDESSNSPSPVPNGPLTPGPGPVYGPAPHQYGQPPPPTYGPIPQPPAGAGRQAGTGDRAGTGDQAGTGDRAGTGGQAGAGGQGNTVQIGTMGGAWASPGQARPLPGQPYPPGYQPVGGGPAPVGRPLRSDYASWGRRVAGYLIDFAPALVASIPLLVAYVLFIVTLLRVPVGQESTFPDLTPLVGWIVAGMVLSLAALGWTIYNRWLTAGRTGQSLGKRVMRLRLISEQTGHPIGALNAFVRDLAHYLDGLAYVGFLWPLWDDRRQTFADMIMHTVVIEDPVGTATSESQGFAS